MRNMGGAGSGGYRGNIIYIKAQAEIKKLLEHNRNNDGHQKMAVACWLVMRELLNSKEDFIKLFSEKKYDELLARWSRTEDEIANTSALANWKRELKKRGYPETLSLDEVKTLSRIDGLRKNSKLNRELEDAEDLVAHRSATVAEVEERFENYPNMSKAKKAEEKRRLNDKKKSLKDAKKDLEFVRKKIEIAISL